MLFTVSGHFRNSIYIQQKQENMTTVTASRENAHRKFDAFVIHKVDNNSNYRGGYIAK